jgi:hypothetical protein
VYASPTVSALWTTPAMVAAYVLIAIAAACFALGIRAHQWWP